MRLFLDEKWQQLQRQKMVSGTDLIADRYPARRERARFSQRSSI